MTLAVMSSSHWIFSAGMKSCLSLKVQRMPVGVAADAEVGALDGPALELEDVARRAVDHVDGEVRRPVVAPLGPVEALDEEDEGLDALGDGLEPGVVLVGVEGRGREELDDRAEGALARRGWCAMRRRGSRRRP